MPLACHWPFFISDMRGLAVARSGSPFWVRRRNARVPSSIDFDASDERVESVYGIVQPQAFVVLATHLGGVIL